LVKGRKGLGLEVGIEIGGGDEGESSILVCYIINRKTIDKHK